MGKHLIAFVLAAAALGGGCVGGDAQPQLHITDIEVTNEVDTLAGALDMEVHLFDATTHEHLGCSGRDEGMEPVDVSDVAYGIEAHFVSATDGFRMTPDDLIGHAIEVQVIEDDAEPCPVAPGVDDDVVGISPVDIGAFDLGQTLAFDDVVALRIAIE
ncbi:MAG: hypothetical protein K8W52_43925 [Deltaproteobacteria bacterium]|nr:hypothetical protein [Deltaproteobacteria bacterium]